MNDTGIETGGIEAGGRAITVHGHDDAIVAARAAAELAVPVTLVSAEGAAAYAGAGWFLALAAQAAEAFPHANIVAVLDCGGQFGAALGALRAGAKALVFTGPAAEAETLSAVAEAHGAVVSRVRPRALDLRHKTDKDRACRAWMTLR